MTNRGETRIEAQVDDVRLRLDGPMLTVQMGAGPEWRAEFTHGGDVHGEPMELGIRLRYRPFADEVFGHGPLEVHVDVRVEDDGVSVEINAPADYPFTELPDPLITADARDWSFLIPDGEGLVLRGDGSGPGQRPRIAFDGFRVTLPVVALFDAQGSAVVVTAVEGHDHAVGLEPGAWPGMRLVQLAAGGCWAYRRTWRIGVVASGGLPAVAELVRRELRRGGVALKPLGQKLEHVPPGVHGSLRGTTVWAHFDTLTAELVSSLRDASLRQIRVMGRPVDEAARAALAVSGYASGPYFQTFDVFPAGSVQELGWRGTYPPEGASDGWTHDCIRDQKGWLDPAWLYLPFPRGERFWEMEDHLDQRGGLAQRRRYRHGQVQVQSYRRCPSRHRAVIERHGLPMLNELGASAVFLDIATAMWGLECYAPEHPCDRREDVRFRRDALAAVSDDRRAVYSEAGKWWALDDVLGFEGLLSYDQEMNGDCMQLTDYPEDLGRRKYEFSLGHRVPFFGMVAGDAVTRTLWWGTGQDRHRGTWPSKDALAALFGANPIFVVDPDHPLRPGTSRWRRFVDTASAFDALAETRGDARVTAFEVSGDHVGLVQFDGGASVEANVGFESYDGLAAGEFVVRDGRGSTVAHVEPRSS